MTKTKSDIHKYPKPSVCIDLVIFTYHEDKIKILLRKREGTHAGKYSLPGSFLNIDETFEKGIQRVLKDKVDYTKNNIYFEQLYTFGEPKRDPRGRVLSIAYIALVSHDLINIKDKKRNEYFNVYKLPQIAFDHKDIISYGIKRLRAKLEYTNIVYSLLPNKFTLTELQSVYESIYNKKLDKRNFRKKIDSLKIIKSTGQKKSTGAHRPAELFTFTSKKPQEVDML